MQIETAKEKVTKVILNQPDDALYEEIIREVAFARMVDNGIEDVRAGRILSNNEMESRIRSWRK